MKSSICARGVIAASATARHIAGLWLADSDTGSPAPVISTLLSAASVMPTVNTLTVNASAPDPTKK